jgi:oxalate decarboxylase
MDESSRRNILALGTAAGLAGLASPVLAASPGNPDEPPQGLVNTQQNPRSAVDPGPQNPAISGQFPQAFTPPATDVGDLPQFWASFNNAPRRIQNGGWARQVTQADFQIAEEISGVNMRLDAGGVRELHWHQAAEWAFMNYGNCRITALDFSGRAYVADVKEGDLWYFPAGCPHSLQGLGPDGCEFILAFDSGKQSEYNTLLVTDWMAHTPPDVLADNFGVPAETFSKIFTHNLWIFQSSVPGPLAADQDAVKSPNGPPPNPFTYSLASGPIARQTRGGMVQIADSHNFKAATTVAVAMVTVHPGGIREMHWHPNADEWQYYVKGSAQMAVFNTGPKAVTNNFKPGDIGYIPRNLGHYIKNVGDTDLVFLEIFRTDTYQEVSLSDWLTHTPSALVAAHFNLSAQEIAKFPNNIPVIMPL